ncbi:MAG TPA: 2-oxo acid dehydrogenase subunit E2, partial [Paracoccaceae bacterium]|nr:2-oxo acid dehydrogenase subunit E2 [Paracoccaceae bacterium]
IVIPEGTEGVKVNAVIAVLLEEGEDASAIAETAGADLETAAPEEPEQKAPEPASEAAPEEAAPEKAAPEKTAQRPSDAAESAASEQADGLQQRAPAREKGERIFASPLARRMAEEKGIDLAQVTGSGPRGRIVKADIEGFKPAAPEAPREAAAPTGPIPELLSTDQVRQIYQDRPHTEIPLDGMRRTIATRMAAAKQQIPHYYLRRDVRMDTLLELRRTMNRQLESSGTKLSINDFVIKASAMALKRVAHANVVWAGDRILQLESADVAVAVAIENGLLTPVIRDAHSKGLAQISAEMADLAERARDRKLQPHEYQGGSFAISNLGMYGVENFDAVINPPHGSILAVGAGIEKPVVIDGAVGIATVMSVTLSVDHRVMDGAEGAIFLDAIHTNLENPMMMLA